MENEDKKNNVNAKEKLPSSNNLIFYFGLIITIFGFILSIMKQKLLGVIVWIIGAMMMVFIIQRYLKEKKDLKIFGVGFKIIILLASIFLLYLAVYIL